MEVAKTNHDGLHDVDALAKDISVHQVVKAAHDELRQLLAAARRHHEAHRHRKADDCWPGRSFWRGSTR